MNDRPSSDPCPRPSQLNTLQASDGCETPGCCRPREDRRTLGRREFLALGGAGAAAVGLRAMPVMAGPFEDTNEYLKLIPVDKRLDPAWVRSLTERGEPTVYTGDDLKFIGMPVGGIGAGHVYLGGDGRLWLWDIFNEQHARGLLAKGAGGETYLNPLEQVHPFEQGFSIVVGDGDEADTRPLTREGFSNVTFEGRYPMATVTYRDDECPVDVALEAFSPFIPLDLDNSSYPAVVLRYTVRNTSDATVEVKVAGSTDNPVCLLTRKTSGVRRRNDIHRDAGLTILDCNAEELKKPAAGQTREDILFDDFEKPEYDGWTTEGTAFGTGPVERKDVPAYQGDLGGRGRRVVNSHASAPGGDVREKDAETGTLTSKSFTIERRYINFFVGGGAHKGKTCVNLLVDDKPVRTVTGKSHNHMEPHSFDVSNLEGKTARLQVVDAFSEGWGNIGIDHVVFSDQPRQEATPIEERHDYGTFALALVGEADEVRIANLEVGSWPRNVGPPRRGPVGPFSEQLVGGLCRQLKLAPGQEETVTFIVAWHFPNLIMPAPFNRRMGRAYAARFPSAAAVARHVAANLDDLYAKTKLWTDTWYDSTLPYWFLDRTMANTSTLATSTCYLFEDGRFYGWEGIACCAGTCAHVWHYAQAPGRLFPELERRVRERVDFGLALHEDGRIGYRGELHGHHADDGQCGRILGVLREHQMSPDGEFLGRLWPNVKRAVEFMLARDETGDGILDGAQPNTLDAAWFGKISFTSSLLLAALKAGEAMAREMGDEEFAGRCAARAAKGAESILELYNGEYFIQIEDPRHQNAIGVGPGCYIDQVFGQTWAHWVGLGRLFDRENQLSALRALWKHNFVPDVGPFRERFTKGRWYAAAGDAGLLMCTWPKGGKRDDWEKHWQYMYFNECMTGFEWQAAAHMIWEGHDQPDLLQNGLAVGRAIHDRYHARLRNPYNEIECSDHYARAMASYGAFQAACGFECHGPKGHLAFDPRLTPDDFRAPFTTAEGWGTFAQSRDQSAMSASVALKHGRLRLATLALDPGERRPTKVEVRLDDQPVAAKLAVEDGRATIQLAEPVVLAEGQTVRVELA